MKTKLVSMRQVLFRATTHRVRSSVTFSTTVASRSRQVNVIFWVRYHKMHFTTEIRISSAATVKWRKEIELRSFLKLVDREKIANTRAASVSLKSACCTIISTHVEPSKSVCHVCDHGCNEVELYTMDFFVHLCIWNKGKLIILIGLIASTLLSQLTLKTCNIIRFALVQAFPPRLRDNKKRT